MASSSVSQDDFDNDFEKLERRSRIRTARARQINPQSCRIESNQERLPPIGIEIEDSLEQPYIDSATVSPYSVLDGGDTSPKPVPRNREPKISSEKRPVKLHHANKGKNQRDRRKLREKRRSTGVVHLASTESTGGSTSGEDEESIEGVETKRNTIHNESIQQDVQVSSPPVEIPERKNSGHKHQSPLYSRLRLRGDKSPRSEDLEADDEQGDKTDNDHDSLNLSESSSVTSLVAAAGNAGLLVETLNSNNSTPVLRSTTPTMPSSSSAPVIRPTTPTIASTNSTPVMRPTTPTLIDNITSPEDRDRCLEENKALVAMMEEKDRRIQFLELKIQQLTLDTQGLVEEYSRVREENATLIKTIGNLSK